MYGRHSARMTVGTYSYIPVSQVKQQEGSNHQVGLIVTFVDVRDEHLEAKDARCHCPKDC